MYILTAIVRIVHMDTQVLYAQKLILSSYVHERKIKHSNGKFEKVLTEINKNVYLACLLPEFITLYNLSFDISNLSYDTL